MPDGLRLGFKKCYDSPCSIFCPVKGKGVERVKVYAFDQEVGKEIGVYGSRELMMSKILMSEQWHESGSESGMTINVVEGPIRSPDMVEMEVQPYL